VLAGCACTRDDAAAAGRLGRRRARTRPPAAGNLPTFDASRAAPRQAAVLVIVGAGIAGLAAARGFQRAGVDDVQLLELEDQPGGNSRGHRMGGMACPLGAHYLPLPGAHAHEVASGCTSWACCASELGRTVADERHLCHSPQERLFFDGAWHEGLLPPADPGGHGWRSTGALRSAVAAAPAFSHAAPPQRLDGRPRRSTARPSRPGWTRRAWTTRSCAGTWTTAAATTTAPAGTVSAWAGLHYFASRHGFHAPGDGDDGERDAGASPGPKAMPGWCSAWPRRCRAASTPATVLRWTKQRHAVQVLAWQGDRPRPGPPAPWCWPLPLFVAARCWSRPRALRQAAAASYAPWLVANLQLDQPLLDRPGPAVGLGQRGLRRPGAGLRRRHAPEPAPARRRHGADGLPRLPATETRRAAGTELVALGAAVVDNFSTVHPDLRSRLQRIDLMRYGHAMAVPLPGGRPARRRAPRCAAAAAGCALRMPTWRATRCSKKPSPPAATRRASRRGWPTVPHHHATAPDPRLPGAGLGPELAGGEDRADGELPPFTLRALGLGSGALLLLLLAGRSASRCCRRARPGPACGWAGCWRWRCST
jgi:hypothetical protein